ncbi:CST complex subunit TEN1, partial [Stegastes partitus]|uniref:CST complex subunit TEN1 n=1 Tax=Stegastes partitus TaxID=144197 RepID=A0A9Y4N1B0_9TELE
CYQPEESRATLSAQHASKDHQVVVHTLFVEPFNPIVGAQYIALGEIEKNEEVGVMVQARVLNCVDGVNIALLQKAISEQRSFFKERESKQGDAAQAADAT